RPLRRYLQREVETRIARALVAGDIHDGATIFVDVDGDELTIRWQSPADGVSANGAGRREPDLVT
ncbi:MAG TPA: hypothetical protein VGM33_05600, partial [Baekduia sp.]